MSGRPGEQALWRRQLSRELAGLIAIKLAALALLWWLFFSPTHRVAVDADAAGHRLGVTELRTSEPARAAPARRNGRGDD
jgi:hypothetical protein